MDLPLLLMMFLPLAKPSARAARTIIGALIGADLSPPSDLA